MSGLTTIASILAGGVVLWWFVGPNSNGVNFLAGLFGDIISFFKFLFGAPITGGLPVSDTGLQ